MIPFSLEVQSELGQLYGDELKYVLREKQILGYDVRKYLLSRFKTAYSQEIPEISGFKTRESRDWGQYWIYELNEQNVFLFYTDKQGMFR